MSMIQAAPSGAGGASGILIGILPWVAIFAIFYMLMIRPQQQRVKQHQAEIAAVKKGDEVVTGGGIFGRITAMDEERGFVILQISDNTKVKVLRSAVVGLAGEPETAAAATTTPGS